MMSYLIEVTLCWALFYALYLALLSRATFFTPNRLYLGLSILLGLLLPLTPEWTAEMAERAPAAVYYLQPITVGAQQVEMAISAPAAREASISWTVIIKIIYITGVLLAFSRFAYGLYKIGRLYISSERSDHASYRLVHTDKDHTPFSFFHILFWSQKRSYPDKDRQKIIRHEVAHMRGWHSLDIMLIEILKIIFWFSPPVYLYSRAIRAVHEYLADEAVLKTESKKKQYGHLLIRQSVSGSQIALANHFFHSQLKKRIIMMTKTKSKRQSLGRYLLVFPLVIGLAFAFAMPADGLPTSNSEVISSLNGEELPVFAGCEELDTKKEQQECTKKKLMAFMSEKLVYPEAAKAAKKEGTVIVKFTVNDKGLVENARILRGAGYGMDNAALEVVNTMPRWTPAKENGKAVATELSLPFKFALPDNQNSEVFKVAEEMPRFPGCEHLEDHTERGQCAQMQLFSFMAENTQYPKSAKLAGVEGMVVVEFVVSKNGELRDVKVIRSEHPSMAEEAKRVVLLMQEMEEQWIPGRQDGAPVAVQMKLPFSFKLPAVKEEQTKSQQLELNSYQLRPNPSNGMVGLKFRGKAESLSIRIYDTEGRELMLEEIPNFDGLFERSFDLSQAPRGTLFLQIRQGERVFTDKIVLQ